MSLHHIKAIAIDLDGTLLDTIPDLCASVNLVLDGMGHEPLPIDLVKTFVGKGPDGPVSANRCAMRFAASRVMPSWSMR